MTSEDHDDLLRLAHEVVDEAKVIFLRDSAGQHTVKGDRDFATEVDFSIERLVRERLADATPEIGFVGEESGDARKADRWWCLDPIDGTVNFAAGSPLCAVSLALVQNDRPVIGVVDAPYLGDRYAAIQGRGATKNGSAIATRPVDSLTAAILSFGDFAVGPTQEDRFNGQQRMLSTLAREVQRVRMLGTAALDLVWLAEGRHAASIIVGGKVWDVAAGQIIAQESGAVVLRSVFSGDDATIVCDPSIQQQLGELVDVALASSTMTG